MPVQRDLFAPADPLPGLVFIEDAIGLEQEQATASSLDAAPLAPFQFGQWQGRRLTMNYGSAYDYQAGRPTQAPPLPDWLLRLRADLAQQVGLRAEDFVQALLIRYDPGAGIGWHRDRPQYGTVMGLSLSAPAVLRFRRRTAKGFERRNVELPRRSLYVLSGGAREGWEHSIAPMEQTRRSVTFRTMR